MFQLSNDLLNIKVKAKGAELCEISSVKNNRQFMWHADPKVWASYAPNLFPIIGSMKDDSYVFNEKTYHMPKHGFVRHNEDIKLLEHLEGYLTENRLERFHKVLDQRTKHFTVATEDVYQLHNTSAVIRSCDVFGIQEVNIVEEQNTKRIDREIAMGAQKWVDLNRFHTVKDLSLIHI